MSAPSLEIFVDENDGVESVGLILRDASIIEDEDELVACCRLTAKDAKGLVYSLVQCIEQMEA